MKLFEVNTQTGLQIVRSSRGRLYLPIRKPVLPPLLVYNFLKLFGDGVFLPRWGKRPIIFMPFIEVNTAIKYAVDKLCKLRPDEEWNHDSAKTLFIAGQNTGLRVAASVEKPTPEMVGPHLFRLLKKKP